MRHLLVAVLVLGACGGERSPESAETSGDVPTSLMTTGISVATTSSASTSSTSLPRGFDFDWFDRTLLDDTVGRGSIDVQAAVVRDGEVIHRVEFSAASSPAPVSSDSRFRIASISKVATAMAVMRSVEDGVMSLDDRPLAEVAGRLGFSLVDPRLNDVTVYQLLSHTSGLSSSGDLFFDSPGLDADGVLAAVVQSPLVDDPGRQFTYSNANYVILGRLLGWRTGTSWEGATRLLVLDPLRLDDWQVGRTSMNDEGDAQYASESGRNYMELLEAAGAWVASATDVALLVDALGRGTIFGSPATSRMMVQPSSAGPLDEDWTYGLGVRIFAGGMWGHSGTLENTHDMVVWLPDGTVVSVLVNGKEPSDSDMLIDTIRRALTPEPPSDSAASSTSIG